MRKPIKQSKRFAVFSRDNYTCQYCGKKAPNVTLEIDHKIPVSKGGNNAIENLVTSCFDCNRGKGAKILPEKRITISAKSDFELLFAAAAENLGRDDREKLFYRKLFITAYTSFGKINVNRLFAEIIRCGSEDSARRNIFYMVFEELLDRIEQDNEE